MGVNGDGGEIFSESSCICQSLCGARYQDKVAVWDRAKFNGEDMWAGSAFGWWQMGIFLMT